jgi:hypothetical protein
MNLSLHITKKHLTAVATGLTVASCLIHAQFTNDGWSATFGDPGLQVAGLQGAIPAAGPSATAVDADGNYYLVGGGWNRLDGMDGTGYAVWNRATDTWSLFGGIATNGGIFAMGVAPDGTVYVGGQWSFFLAGTALLQTGGIVKWDGTQWSEVGGGLSGGFPFASVEAITFDADGNLYVGGIFSTAGGVPARNVARWDGTNWSALGNGLETRVAELAFGPDGKLYAGGVFAEGDLRRIACWDGTMWTGLSQGFTSGEVNSIVFDDEGNLYAGGTFFFISDPNVGPNFIETNHVAQWDGIEWKPMGSGFNEVVRSLVYVGGRLYAGGQFTATGDETTPLSKVAVWDNAEWKALGDGMDLIEGPSQDSEPNVFHLDLSVNPDDPMDKVIIAGGPFDRAGDKVSNNVALWKVEEPGGILLVPNQWNATPYFGWVWGYAESIGYGENLGPVFLGSFPWIYHYTFGWLYYSTIFEGTLYYYSLDLGWIQQDATGPWFTYFDGSDWVWSNFIDPQG